ncbi:Dabb family protein [Yeosuana sp. MJ-SS3]|uniref:Dabb family protein n=1 Tax=Gilvirhabdus luticola TaxID=3079858 RepID=A0ABU3UAW6_9FLAO|nr:Dabb family protein [Yeosuana sp. MJ-SS3]MDU8887235.1 Dabb family protein [Yeosuana sp. MJ-SS3]
MKFKTIYIIVLVFASSLVYSQANINTQSGLLQHVIMIKWTDNADKTAINEVLSLFNNLPDKIDGFERLDVHKVVQSSGDFEIVIVMQFVSQEALDRYQVHPDHSRIKDIGTPLLSNFAEVDYWKD